MSKVDVARLKKSLETSEAESYREGRESGFEWASKYAEAIQLKRLQRYHRDALRHSTWEEHFVESPSVAFNHFGAIGTIVACTVSDDYDHAERSDMEEFCECALGDDHETLVENHEYMRGFFEGAIEAWEQAEAQM